jgi:hypothetical protein
MRGVLLLALHYALSQAKFLMYLRPASLSKIKTLLTSQAALSILAGQDQHRLRSCHLDELTAGPRLGPLSNDGLSILLNSQHTRTRTTFSPMLLLSLAIDRVRSRGAATLENSVAFTG